MRLFLPESGIPPGAEVVLMQQGFARNEYPGFTRVASWDYHFDLSPTLALRILIERDVLGRRVEFQQALGVSLHVRNDSALLPLYSDA
jgi:hypothetical protein